MRTPFYLEILGVHIYYLDGAEMSNEKEVPQSFSSFIGHFLIYPVLIAIGV
jgi:hypothetical protein